MRTKGVPISITGDRPRRRMKPHERKRLLRNRRKIAETAAKCKQAVILDVHGRPIGILMREVANG